MADDLGTVLAVPVDHDPWAVPKPGQTVPQPQDPIMALREAAGNVVQQARPYWMDLDPTDQEIAQRQSAMQTGQTQPGKVLPTTGMNPVPFAMLDAASMLPAGGLAKFASGMLGIGAKRALGAAAEAGAGAAERGVAGAAAEAAPAGIRAYHGSPHDFTQFDLSKIGTGEGAQAYGHGLYLAENEAVAREYRNTLADWKVNGAAPDPSDPAHIAAVTLKANEADPRKAIADLARTATEGPVAERATAAQAIDLIRNGAALPKATGGHMYEVNIGARPEHFLDWDKPLSEQSEHIKSKIGHLFPPETTGQQAYQSLIKYRGDQGGGMTSAGMKLSDLDKTPQSASGRLNATDIPGIRYLDQGSRGAGEGSRNYVVFDPKMIEIMRKYGIIGAAGGMGAGAMQQQYPLPFQPGM